MGEGCLFSASYNWAPGPPGQGSNHSLTCGSAWAEALGGSSWLLAWIAADQASAWSASTFVPGENIAGDHIMCLEATGGAFLLAG